MKVVLLFLFGLFGLTTWANTPILVYHDSSSENSQLMENAKEALLAVGEPNGLSFKFTSDATSFSYEQLSHFSVVVFLNTSVNALDYRQSAAFEQFMRAGGGFVGVHSAAQPSYQWLWYGNMLKGKLNDTQLDEASSFSLITNVSLGGISVSPYWKVFDKPLVFNTLPTDCKPVLLDLSGRTWAWYGKTSYGGKMFYTALGGTPEAYQSPDFRKHILAGIKEVIPTNQLSFDTIADSALPPDSDFIKEEVVSNLSNPIAFTVLPNDHILILEADGDLLLYDHFRKLLRGIGYLPKLQGAVAIKPDPEFATNGYIYSFSPSTDETNIIQRFVVERDSVAYQTDFVSVSATPITKSERYQAELYQSSPFCFPKYYDKKVFRVEPEQGLFAETRHTTTDEIINIEPFVPSLGINQATGLGIDSEGKLLVLSNNQLLRVVFKGKAIPFSINAFADIYEAKILQKISFYVNVSTNEAVTYQWSDNEQVFSEEANPVYSFKEAGKHTVQLKVTTAMGTVAEHWVDITITDNKKKK